jgi:cytochrome c2
VGRDIFFVSMTVDPEHDTPALLKAFAEAFDASAPGWQFVTGQPDDIKAINAKFGDRSAERSLSSHRNEILIGNDATGDWQRDSAFNDVSQLVMTIRLMNPAFRNQPGVAGDEIAGDPGTPRLSDQPGQALFRRMCAPCHTIGGGRHVGPDLKGVADRRSHDWLVDFIMSPANMLARKDPDALALVAGFPGVKMPSIGLGKTDAEGLIGYLRQETSQSSATVQSSNRSK